MDSLDVVYMQRRHNSAAFGTIFWDNGPMNAPDVSLTMQALGRQARVRARVERGRVLGVGR